MPELTFGRRRRKHRKLALVAAAIALLLLVFYGGGGWFFSNLLRDEALDADQRRAALAPEYRYEVLATGRGTVTIRVPAEAGDLLTGGIWGLRWPDRGYGRLGRIRRATEDRVVREFAHMTGPSLEPGTRVATDERAFPVDPKVGLGMRFDDVTVEGELGSLPAWFIDGSRNTWVILVHGNALTRRDGLRLLPVLAAEGFPTLTITYRNDPETAKDPSGMLRYGLAEWKDLEAAARYALDNGAEDLVLAGYSMGGGVVANFLYRSPLAERVTAVVLEAPMLDFGRTVDFNAAQEKLPLIGSPVPQSLTSVAKFTARVRFGVDWRQLDYLERADELRAPILLIHGTADEEVPIETSEELAAARPDLVTFKRVKGAEHMEAWNVDSASYEQAVRAFLRAVVP